MKKYFPFSPVLLLIFLMISCDVDDVDPQPAPEPPVPATDTYNYLALRNDGRLFEIGNATGNITPASKIPGLEFNTVFNAIAISENKIFIYEHEFDPFRGHIHVYDKASRTSTAHAVEFPEEIFGEFAGLVALEWDEDNGFLIGIVKENFESNFPPSAIIARINPETFEVTSLGIQIERAPVKSTVLVDSRLYVSVLSADTGQSNGFFSVNLEDETMTEITFEEMALPPVHLSANESGDKIFGFLPVPNSSFMGAAQPVLIDLANEEIKRFLPGQNIGIKNDIAGSFFNPHTNEFVDIITSETFHALLQYNELTEELKVTELEMPNDLGSLVGIIGVREL